MTFFDKTWKLIYSDNAERQEIEQQESEVIDRIYTLSKIEEPDYDELWNQAMSKLRSNRRRSVLRYAAVFIPLIIGVTTLLLVFQKHEPETSKSGMPVTLVLSDGSTINLDEQKWDDTRAGEFQFIADRDDTGISYADAGDVSIDQDGEIIFHTLDIPATKTFRIRFADGTVAWLNSGTRLKYPAVFGESERRISLLAGEACFEVANDQNRRFIVEANGQEIEALGTLFNVNTYSELMGAVETTLLNGRVRISNGVDEVILSPGQQALYTTDNTFIVTDVVASNYVAWREGRFIFVNKPLGEILSHMSRWYGFDIRFKHPELADLKFTGIIEKNYSAEDTFALLEKMADIQFEHMEGDSIVVKKR